MVPWSAAAQSWGPSSSVHGKRPLRVSMPSLLGLAAAAALVLTLGGMEGLPYNDARKAAVRSVGANHAGQPGVMLPGTPLSVLRNCTDFRCLRAAHALPRGPGQTFNFPHFFIIGFPKCATTSLAAYLQRHPQAVSSQPKETRFFNSHGNCSHLDIPTLRWGCDKAKEEQYLVHTLGRDKVVQSGMARAAFEATTDYAWMPGMVAAGIRRELPWLRLVVSMREPISAEISGLVHRMQVINRLARTPGQWPDWWIAEPVDECLDRLRTDATALADCVRIKLDTKMDKELWFDYSHSMASWLHAFPPEQLYVIQYENLTAPGGREAVLADMQRFLGLDPDLAPAELPSENSRRGGEHPDGWPMRQERYQEFLTIAKAASERLATVLEQHGLMGGRQWLEAWEAAWARNLASCSEAGDCMIQLT